MLRCVVTDRALKNIAVLLAGGVGTRVGLDIPKQLIKIAGRPIMEHTLATLDAHPMVDEIIVLMAQGHLDAVHAMIRNGGYTKVTHVLEGAETRNETTLRAIRAVADHPGVVIGFHQFADLRDLVLRHQIAARFVDARLPCNGGRSALVVTAKHDDFFHTRSADGLQRLRRLRPQGVSNGDDA